MKKYNQPQTEVQTFKTETLMQGLVVSTNGSYDNGGSGIPEGE